MTEPKIVSDPKILFGKPVIAGTRISVELILEELGSGMSVDDLLRGYPHLTKEQVLTAISFAAQAIRHDVIYPFTRVPAWISSPTRVYTQQSSTNFEPRDTQFEPSEKPIPVMVDPDVLAVAMTEHAILLTQDKDFGELVVRLGMNHCGMVLIRLAGMAAQVRAQWVSELFRDHATELPNAFTVISPGGVRIRPPGTQP
jgi:uncharacterized protein (DUF433 family)/predicted nuclease of predicted toxin-antitoxin system